MAAEAADGVAHDPREPRKGASVAFALCVWIGGPFQPRRVAYDSPGRSPGTGHITTTVAPKGLRYRERRDSGAPSGLHGRFADVSPGLAPGLS